VCGMQYESLDGVMVFGVQYEKLNGVMLWCAVQKAVCFNGV